jgi:DNA-binding SARP family transcriptional activator
MGITADLTVTQGGNVRARLVTFGKLELTLADEGAGGGYGAGKVLALLAYLSAAPGHRATRDQLADLLWSREDRAKGRQSLRQAVFTLRRLLGNDAVESDDEVIALAAGVVDVDRDRFLAACARDDAEAALDLHHAPFLDGVSVRGADSFEEWVAIERAALLRRCLRVGTTGITTALALGDGRGAEAMARRLLTLGEADPAVVAGLCEALVMQGRGSEGLQAVDDALARAVASGDAAPEALAKLAARLRRATPVRLPGSGDAVDLMGIGSAFVGREELLQQIFASAEQARRRQPGHVHLVGPAGIGKSRLLDECALRLRQRGVTVVSVRFPSGGRNIPYVGFAALARELGQLPAALGIASSHAAVLVAAVPELLEHFPGAAEGTVVPTAAADLLRVRTEALRELLSAVAESRLVVLMLDDLHVCDAESLQVIAAARPEAPTRAALISAGRTPWTATNEVTEVHLCPFTEEDVRALLLDVAALPEEPWVGPLLQEMARAGRGVPFVIMRRLRDLQRRGLLVEAEGRWAVADAEATLAAVRTDDDGVWVSVAQPPEAMALLHLLALWPRPLEEERLIRLVAPVAGLRTAGEVRERLARLERDGLVVANDGRWSIAHALIEDEVRARHTPAQDLAAVERVIQWCEDDGVLTWGQLRKVAYLCGRVDDVRSARRLARAASGWAGRRALGYRTRPVVSAIVAASGRPEWERTLRAALPWTARLGRGALTAMAVLAGMLIAAGGFYWFESLPRLEIDQEPLVEATEWGQPGTPDNYVFRTQPRIRVVDGFGRDRPDVRGRIRVVMETTDSMAVLRGDTIVELEDGYARFSELVIEHGRALRGEAPPVLRFSGAGALGTAQVQLRGVNYAGRGEELTLVRVTVDGVTIDPARPITVRTGDSLRLGLMLDYTTPHPTANIPLGFAVTWGLRDSSVTRITGLPRPVRAGRLNSEFTVVTPPEPGHHHIIIALGYEESVDHIMSGTNWTLGSPRWNDGNDVQDLSEAQLDTLNRDGRYLVPGYRIRTWGGRDPYGQRTPIDYTGALIWGRVLHLDVLPR